MVDDLAAGSSFGLVRLERLQAIFQAFDRLALLLDQVRQGAAVERQVRAFNPIPGAWFEANGERIKVLEAAVGRDSSGKASEVLDDCLNIACGVGYIRPLKVQPASRGVMTPGELLRGFPIPKGTILK